MAEFLESCLVKGLNTIITFRHNILGLGKKSSKSLLHSVEFNSKFLKPKLVLCHLETANERGE